MPGTDSNSLIRDRTRLLHWQHGAFAAGPPGTSLILSLLIVSIKKSNETRPREGGDWIQRPQGKEDVGDL